MPRAEFKERFVLRAVVIVCQFEDVVFGHIVKAMTLPAVHETVKNNLDCAVDHGWVVIPLWESSTKEKAGNTVCSKGCMRSVSAANY